MANIPALTKKAASELKKLTHRSSDDFYKISRRVVIESGITNTSDVERITQQVRAGLREHSANARRARSPKVMRGFNANHAG